ncbi:MAG TPA: hypothetical protein VKR06_40550 [Ktedonosporobacter sp.]|nr:hypothetical protein [Ktedonosporobacter sp.]
MAPTCSGRGTDTVYATARGSAKMMMGQVIAPARRSLVLGIPREATCDTCKTISHTRLCPHCHFELSHDVGLIDQRIIAIIGGRATGKTHYIASLITRLQQEIASQFGFTIRMLGDHTQERWERDFYRPLFIRKTVLQPNRPAEVDPQVKAPLIFRLTFENAGRKRVLNLSFFDTAGEDMASLGTMSLQNRYITHADGIVFLLDPLQIPDVRQQFPAAVLPPADPSVSPEHIISRLRDLFERDQALRVTQKVRTPIAFALSKLDVLFPLLEPGSEFHHPGGHCGYLDLDDVQSVHTEVANYLALWISANFRGIIDGGFARYTYFGVSSLGEQPDPENRVSAVSPLRVEDPFLWILYQLGFVKGKRRR